MGDVSDSRNVKHTSKSFENNMRIITTILYPQYFNSSLVCINTCKALYKMYKMPLMRDVNQTFQKTRAY